MSTDYSAVCDVCKFTPVSIWAESLRLGTGRVTKRVAKKVAEWIFVHVEHGDGVRIVFAQSVPSHYYLGDDD